MEKDVVVSIRGFESRPEEEGQMVETSSPGTYYRKGNQEYIIYTEYLEQGAVSHPTRSTIRIQESQVILSRAGSVAGQMVFAVGRSHLVYYNTPFGMMEIRMMTHSLKQEHEEHQIRLLVEYEMTINEQPRGNQSVDIRIFDRFYER